MVRAKTRREMVSTSMITDSQRIPAAPVAHGRGKAIGATDRGRVEGIMYMMEQTALAARFSTQGIVEVAREAP